MKKPKATVEEIERSSAVAKALRAGSRDRATMASAASFIEEGKGAVLFDALVRVYRVDDEDRDLIVPPMNALLESMFDADESNQAIAGYLMAHLMVFGERTGCHTELDGMGLIVSGSVSRKLADYLDIFANEGVRPRTQKMYSGLAADIRARAR